MLNIIKNVYKSYYNIHRQSKIDNSNTATPNGTATQHSKTRETIKRKREQLSCIIKKVGHLINTLPNQDDSQKDCSATDISPPSEVSDSKSSCNKHPFKNECENPLLKANIDEMPVKNISETKVQPTQSKAQCPMDIPSKETGNKVFTNNLFVKIHYFKYFI